MKCSRCDVETDKVKQCDHTKGKDMCKQCYQEIHWLLANNEKTTV
jgi:hypothetical protein